MSRLKMFMLFIAISAVVLLWLYRKYRVAPDLQLRKLELVNLDGKPIDWSTYKGKTIFVNFWASWCPDCIREMPSINELVNNTNPDKIVYLMISDEPLENIRLFAERKGYPMVFLKLENHFQEIGIEAIPAVYVYDAKGNEMLSVMGAINWEDHAMQEVVRSVMEK